MWPQHVPGRVAEKLPVFLGILSHFQSNDSLRLRYLCRQKIAVLIANFLRRTLQMHIDPAIINWSAKGTFETRVASSRAGQEGQSDYNKQKAD